jgi:hypothetical protein
MPNISCSLKNWESPYVVAKVVLGERWSVRGHVCTQIGNRYVIWVRHVWIANWGNYWMKCWILACELSVCVHVLVYILLRVLVKLCPALEVWHLGVARQAGSHVARPQRLILGPNSLVLCARMAASIFSTWVDINTFQPAVGSRLNHAKFSITRSCH